MKKIILLGVMWLVSVEIGMAQSAFPPLKVKMLNGQSKELSECVAQEGYTLFVFWKSCCSNTLGMLSELHDAWSGSDDQSTPITIVLVSVDDARSIGRVRPLIGSNNYPWEVIMDSNKDLARVMNVLMPPQWVAYDSRQREVFRCKITSGMADPALFYEQLQNRIKLQEDGD